MPDTPGSLAEALAALQGQLPRVAKNQRAKVEKDGRTLYTYDYADLADINAALLPIMASVGLSFTCSPTIDPDGRFVLAYCLLHVSGDNQGGRYPLPDPARYGPQDLGKAITYARRYALCAVTGLSPGGDDTDAAEVQHAPERKPRSVPDAQLEAEGRMTRAQLAGHRKLEADTKRDDARKKADRVRPRGPDPEDPWAKDAETTHERAQELRENLPGRDLTDTEDKPGSRLPAQHRAIEMLLSKLGIDRADRAGRHVYVMATLGLTEPLATFDDLTYNQAAEAIKLLSDEVSKEAGK